MKLTNASSFRRMACGLCLLIGPAMLLLATILNPSSGEGDDNRIRLQAIKDDPEMAELSTALMIYGFALVAIGIIGAVHVIRARGVVLANLGGMLAIFGLIMFVALETTTIDEINVVQHLGVDTAEKLDDDIEDYWVAFIVFIPALLGTFVGFILLGAALIRSNLTHTAAGILIILGIVGIPFSQEAEAIAIVANVLLLAGWGLVGLRLLGMTDEQWDGRAPPAGPPPAV